MIAPLTEREWQTNEAVALRLNEVIAVVNMVHAAQEPTEMIGPDPDVRGDDRAGGGGRMRMRGVYQPRPDGEKIDLTNLPKGGTSVIPPPRRYAERIEPEQPGLAHEARDILLDKIIELRAERDDYERKVLERNRECGELRAERDAAQARARELEREIAMLKHAVREVRGNLAYGHTWAPSDTQYVRDAIAALRAALGEEATDAH